MPRLQRRLPRLFSTFPHGRSGLGLLLLRLVLGLVVVRHWFGSDLVSAVAGVLVLVGFLTPVGAVWVAGALSLSQVFSPPTDFNGLSVVLLVSGSVALALLGPGAFSLDARLFGRREIVIPRQRS
jgi:putative oxidoreductase